MYSCYVIDVKDGIKEESGRSWKVRVGHSY
jgi:hypothetical protein